MSWANGTLSVWAGRLRDTRAIWRADCSGTSRDRARCGTVQRGVAQFLHVHPTTICYGHPAMSADLGCGRARMLVAVPALWSTMYPLLAEYRHCGL